MFYSELLLHRSVKDTRCIDSNIGGQSIASNSTLQSELIGASTTADKADYHELGIIRPYWCPGNYNVADFFSKLLEKGLFTMHAHRFGMNFEETIVGKLTEVYQTVHLKEFTDFPKKDEKDPTTVFTDIHFEKKSVAYEAYHLSHGLCL